MRLVVVSLPALDSEALDICARVEQVMDALQRQLATLAKVKDFDSRELGGELEGRKGGRGG